MKLCSWCGRDFYRQLVKRYSGWETGTDFDDRSGRCSRCGESARSESRTTQTLRPDLRSILVLRVQDRGVGDRGWNESMSCVHSGEPPIEMPDRCIGNEEAETAWISARARWESTSRPIAEHEPYYRPAETVLKQGLRAVAGGRYVDFLVDTGPSDPSIPRHPPAERIPIHEFELAVAADEIRRAAEVLSIPPEQIGELGPHGLMNMWCQAHARPGRFRQAVYDKETGAFYGRIQIACIDKQRAQELADQGHNHLLVVPGAAPRHMVFEPGQHAVTIPGRTIWQAYREDAHQTLPLSPEQTTNLTDRGLTVDEIQEQHLGYGYAWDDFGASEDRLDASDFLHEQLRRFQQQRDREMDESILQGFRRDPQARSVLENMARGATRLGTRFASPGLGDMLASFEALPRIVSFERSFEEISHRLERFYEDTLAARPDLEGRRLDDSTLIIQRRESTPEPGGPATVSVDMAVAPDESMAAYLRRRRTLR